MASKSQVALVTGGSRGISAGIAVALARIGFSVAINYSSDRDAAAEAQRLCTLAAPEHSGASFEVFQADIQETPDRERLLDAVKARSGWIDLLVNNAGVAPAPRRDLLEATEESFDRVLSINLRGPFFLTQSVAKFWLAEMEEHPIEDKPNIINISSVSAYAPSINRGDYCMSKAALSMMTQLFAARLAGAGIGVYEIRPGLIKTDMTAPVQEKYDRLISSGLTPIERWGTPDDVGRAVAAIAENRFSFSTGEVFNVDGGFHIHRL